MLTKSWEDVLGAIDAILTGTFDTPEAMAAEVAKVREQLAAMIAEASAATATAEMVSAAAEGAAKAMAKLANVETAIRQKQSLRDMQSKNNSDLNQYKAPSAPSGFVAPKNEVAVKSRGYRGKGFKQFGTDAEKAAHRAGASVAAILGDHRATQFCKDNGIDFLRKDMGTGSDALGGFLVVPELEAAIAYYREERGVARNIMEVATGSTERKERNINVGGTNVLPLGEGQTYTASDVKFDQVGVTAKKFGALTKSNIELSDDAYVTLAEEIAKDHGYAHGVKEDQCAFLGDGTSTYNGIVGVTEAFKALVTGAGGTWSTDGNKVYAAGVQVATGATIASVTLSDIYKTVAKVATFNGLQTRIYMPSQIWYGQVLPLVMAANGNTTSQLVDGVQRQFLGGFEVVFVDELYTPLVSAENSGFICLVGDAAQAGLFYNRQGMSITPSQEAGYLSDQLYWKSTARYGMNWWNIGNGSATASQRKRGALAALVTKNA